MENYKCNHCGKVITEKSDLHEIFTVGVCRPNFFVDNHCFMMTPMLKEAEVMGS